MLHTHGEHCKSCQCVLEKPEIERGWDVCFKCGYQEDGDFDMFESLPSEPVFPVGKVDNE